MKTDEITCGTYQHFRNKQLYEVIGTARHSETHELMVIYKALYQCDTYGNNQVWVRPKDMFLETVVHEGCSVPRFKLIKG